VPIVNPERSGNIGVAHSGLSDYYVLLGRNGKPLAVVEAKQSSKDAELGREQAKQYCHNIQARHNGELPFCFYTNGHEIFPWNLGEAPPQRVQDSIKDPNGVLPGKTIFSACP
jgi:type I site-specific restriction endonuclease